MLFRSLSPDITSAIKNVLYQNVTSGGDENIILVPRKDKPYFNFNVYLESDVSYSLHESKLGWKGISLKFVGKNNVPIPSPFQKSGYGFSYGQIYGTSL